MLRAAPLSPNPSPWATSAPCSPHCGKDNHHNPSGATGSTPRAAKRAEMSVGAQEVWLPSRNLGRQDSSGEGVGAEGVIKASKELGFPAGVTGTPVCLWDSHTP